MKTLSGVTTPGQSGPGRNNKEYSAFPKAPGLETKYRMG